MQKMAERALNSSFQYYLPVQVTGGGDMSSLPWAPSVREPPNSAEISSNEIWFISFASQSSFSKGCISLYC